MLIIYFFAEYRRNYPFGGVVGEREVCWYAHCGKSAHTQHLQQTQVPRDCDCSLLVTWEIFTFHGKTQMQINLKCILRECD